MESTDAVQNELLSSNKYPICIQQKKLAAWASLEKVLSISPHLSAFAAGIGTLSGVPTGCRASSGLSLSRSG